MLSWFFLSWFFYGLFLDLSVFDIGIFDIGVLGRLFFDGSLFRNDFFGSLLCFNDKIVDRFFFDRFGG